ncbi:unnamed protein product [Cyclocybe aegerita]|uniref:Uncharacterized protein n=1 Tax=Cyclocybe aegerita TaxID=1973307 RepID=A0A8S0WZU2_CYCAE|nr:unnamed protein product [Cyclocybe aegerita]
MDPTTTCPIDQTRTMKIEKTKMFLEGGAEDAEYAARRSIALPHLHCIKLDEHARFCLVLLRAIVPQIRCHLLVSAYATPEGTRAIDLDLEAFARVLGQYIQRIPFGQTASLEFTKHHIHFADRGSENKSFKFRLHYGARYAGLSTTNTFLNMIAQGDFRRTGILCLDVEMGSDIHAIQPAMRRVFRSFNGVRCVVARQEAFELVAESIHSAEGLFPGLRRLRNFGRYSSTNWRNLMDEFAELYDKIMKEELEGVVAISGGR